MLAACLLLLLILAACLIRACADSTALVVYGSTAQWQPFIDGFLSVHPNAQIVVLTDPEVDFIAYTDALAASAKFKRLACQFPNARAASIFSGRKGGIVALHSPPANLPRCARCNIVVSEQLFVNTLLANTCGGPTAGKRVVLSAGEVRVPNGWVQLRISAGQAPDVVLHELGGVGIAAVVLATAVTPAQISAVRLVAPEAAISALTETSVVHKDLTCQITNGAEAQGKLAGALLAAEYKGPREVTVDPLVVSPGNKLTEAEVTTLCQLAD